MNVQGRWAEYEPFDRAGLTKWNAIHTCDVDGCENRVAVYDHYGTVAVVLCAEHNGGMSTFGPVYD